MTACWKAFSSFCHLEENKQTLPGLNSSCGWNRKCWWYLREIVEWGKIVRGLQHPWEVVMGEVGRERGRCCQSNRRVNASRREPSVTADAAQVSSGRNRNTLSNPYLTRLWEVWRADTEKRLCSGVMEEVQGVWGLGRAPSLGWEGSLFNMAPHWAGNHHVAGGEGRAGENIMF